MSQPDQHSQRPATEHQEATVKLLPEPRSRHRYSTSCILRFLLEFCFHYTGHQPEIMKTKESDKNSSRPSRPPMPQCGPGRASAPSGFWTSLEEATAALGLSDSSGSPAGQWLGRTTTQVRVSPVPLLFPWARKGQVLKAPGAQTREQKPSDQRSPATTRTDRQTDRQAATQRLHLLPAQAATAYGPPGQWDSTEHNRGCLSGS